MTAPNELAPARLAELRALEAEARAKAKREAEAAKAKGVSDREPVRKRGRPQGHRPGSQRAVAKAAGVSRDTVQRLERQVAAMAELYPSPRRRGGARDVKAASAGHRDARGAAR